MYERSPRRKRVADDLRPGGLHVFLLRLCMSVHPEEKVLPTICVPVGFMCFYFGSVSGVSRSKIDKVTLNALRTRQSLVKGERLVRHEMRAVLPASH